MPQSVRVQAVERKRDMGKKWAYVQAMPRDRLERSVVLNEVRELDRQQRLREGAQIIGAES